MHKQIMYLASDENLELSLKWMSAVMFLIAIHMTAVLSILFFTKYHLRSRRPGSFRSAHWARITATAAAHPAQQN